MNLRLLQGYALAILVVVILVAAGFILLNNIGGEWTMQVVWRPVTLRPAAWLLLAALGGLILWWTFSKLLPTAVSALKAGARLRREKRAQQQLRDLAGRKEQQEKEKTKEDTH